MPDGVVVLNPQAEILWFQPQRLARLLGLRGKGDIGLRIENLVRAPEFRALPAQRPVRPAGDPALERRCRAVPVDADRPYGAGQLLALVRDVTRQARLEDMRKDFVANASHELRSPLTVISGYLETLTLDPGVDPAIVAPLQEMRRQALRHDRHRAGSAGPVATGGVGIARRRHRPIDVVALNVAAASRRAGAARCTRHRC